MYERFYWHSIVEDVKSYIKTCEQCQKQGKTTKQKCLIGRVYQFQIELCTKLGSTCASFQKLMDLNICFFALFLLIIDYLWLMIRLHQLVRKNLPPWMYENSNQWSGKRIRKRSNHLYRITAVEQKITSAYHPQLNGISKSDKYSLINLFQKIVDQWRSMAIYNRWCSSYT